LEPGDHGSTFGGNALSTAAGAAAAKFIVDNDVPALASTGGAYLTAKLTQLAKKYSFISDIRGLGLLIGVEMTKEIAAPTVQECLGNGLLINAVRPNMLRFMPPLNVTEKEIDEAIQILDTSLANTSK